MMLNALTIDLEDWYQGLTSTSQRVDLWPSYETRVADNTVRLLEILSQSGVKATFFVLGYLADHMPDLVKRVAAEGHEIALHSYHHQHVHQLSADQFREEVQRGVEVVQRCSEKPILGYRAPMFSVNRSSSWVYRILSELGFRYDSSIFPIRNMYYGTPGANRFPHHPLANDPFIEFPLSTVRLLGINWPIAGGFYARVLPYTFLQVGIQQLNRQGRPAIMYFHPWEFDLDQRFRKVTPRERITHYHGRASLKTKLINLLQDFQFGTLESLLNMVN